MENFFCIFACLLCLIMEKSIQPIFDKNTIEFVTVAAELCGFLERTSLQKRGEFVDKILKILPLLYLKASLLPVCERLEEDEPETFVTEADYNQLRSEIAALLGNQDDYLEVFLEDMAYSDTPIRQEISESLADIYQVLKDFICVYQLGLSRTMNDALAICRERFAEYWGQRLVNVMRALHELKYSPNDSWNDTDEAEEGVFEDSCTEEELYEGLDMGEDEP